MKKLVLSILALVLFANLCFAVEPTRDGGAAPAPRGDRTPEGGARPAPSTGDDGRSPAPAPTDTRSTSVLNIHHNKFMKVQY